MAFSNSPIFPQGAKVSWDSALTTANAAMDGTGTVSTIFTADATNGSWVDYVQVQHKGTNVQTALRLFINNGSTNATATNNSLNGNYTIPLATASNNTATTSIVIPLNIFLPPGYKLNATIGTSVAAGLAVTAFGRDA